MCPLPKQQCKRKCRGAYSSRRNRTLLLKLKGEGNFPWNKIEEVFGKTFDESVKSKTLSWRYSLLRLRLQEEARLPVLGTSEVLEEGRYIFDCSHCVIRGKDYDPVGHTPITCNLCEVLRHLTCVMLSQPAGMSCDPGMGFICDRCKNGIGARLPLRYRVATEHRRAAPPGEGFFEV